MAFDGLRVDDYSSADQIDVYCDGFVVRIDKTNDAGDDIFNVFDPTLTDVWITAKEKVYDHSDSFFLGFDDKRTTEIIENTPARVRIRIVGNFDKTTGTTDDYLTNSTSFTVIYTIYPDRYTGDYEWVTSGAISVDTVTWAGISNDSAANLTSIAGIVENSASESATSVSTYYDDRDYIGFTSTEVNVLSILPYSSIGYAYATGWGFRTWTGDGAYVFPRSEYDPTGAETIQLVAVTIIDSADRVGGKQYDSSALRLALGDQYKRHQMIVDDYSSADYTDVHCDGYILRFSLLDTDNRDMWIQDPNDLTSSGRWAWGINNGSDGTYTYYLSYDPNRTTEIIENTPARVKLRIIGNLDRTSGGSSNYWPNSTQLTVIYTIYPDRFTIDWEWEASGTVTCTFFWMGSFSFIGANVASEDHVIEDGGSESTPSFSTNYAVGSYEYLACLSDEVNFLLKQFYDSTGNFTYRSGNDPEPAAALRIGTNIAVGINRGSHIFIVDSADRVGGKQYDSEALRLALGDWYQEHQTVEELVVGSKVMDMHFPLSLAEFFASDGAWHGEPDSDRKFQLTWDRTRHKPNLQIHDYPFISGEDAEQYLLNHLKCNDFAASSVVVAEVGNNANWETIAAGANRDTDTHGDSSGGVGVGERGLNTQDGTSYIDMSLTEHGNAFLKKGSVFIRFKPQFPYDVGAPNRMLWHLYFDADNRIRCFYENVDGRIQAGATFGGTTVYLDTTDYLSNDSFQIWQEVLIFWDYANDIIGLVINGKLWDFSSSGWSSATSSNPTSFKIGCQQDRSEPADIIIDEVKTYSEVILNHETEHLITHLKLDENAASPCLESQVVPNVNDDFTGTNGDAPDIRLWTEDDSSNLMDIQSNKLNFAFTGTASSGVPDLNSKWRFNADEPLEIIIDFDVTTIDATDGADENFIQIALVGSDGSIVTIARARNSASDGYAVDGSVTSLTWESSDAADSSGKLKLVSDGTTIKGYRWSGSQWEWDGSTDGFTYNEDFTGEIVKVNISFRKYATSGSTTVDANIDNFIVNSGTPVSAMWRAISDQSLRDTDTSGDSVDGVRGNALDTQDGVSYIDMGLVGYDNAFFKKGSVLIKFKPLFGYDVGSGNSIVDCNVTGINWINLWYDPTDDKFHFAVDFEGTTRTLLSPAYTSNNDLQQWHTVLLAWDFDNDIMIFVLDGEVVGVETSGWTTALSDDPTTFTIGAKNDQANPADIIYDEIKIFKEFILPYGSVFVGNGEVNAEVADPDVCLHYDFENSGANATNIPADKTVTLNGSAVLVTTDPIYGSKHLDCVNADDEASIPVVSYDIIDPRHGSVSVWVNFQALPSAWSFFFSYGDTVDSVRLGLTPDNYLFGQLDCGDVAEQILGDVAVVTNRWYHYLFKFSDSNNDGFIELWVDGKFIGYDTVANANAYGGTGTLYLGVSYDGSSKGIDCFIDQLTITKNPYTPQNWSAFGKPLWRPIVRSI